MTERHKWVVHGERLVDDTSHIRVSLADVELPNHVRFTQAASLALARSDSPARVPILAHMAAIDAELAGRDARPP